MKNRIVMAPMTRSFAEGGMVGAPQQAYYRRRAEGEVGLIVTEGTVVDRPASRNEAGVPYFHGEALDGWANVVKEVHDAGGLIAPQIWHVGAVKSLTTDFEPDAPFESPSGLLAPGNERGVVMSETDVTDTIAAFAKAASDAKRLGFDALEVHGAHGYLVDQFFWSGTNLRTDRWGGASLRDRTAFAAEMIRAIRKAVGEDFPLILRVSQWKQQDFEARLALSPDEMADWLCPLVEAGVDILHCSQRRYWEAEFPELDGEKGLNFAGWAKKLTGAATISVGSVGLSSDFINVFNEDTSTPAAIDGLVERMEKEEFDLIAVGRTLIVEPEWPRKIRTGKFDGFRPFSRTDLYTLD
ncbi:12-oxophytodienoate reductase [Altererythrobacter aquaemixtae]|uniref:12-oxophytodienoate reductase n=2 Tax=Pontixanthobacter aquaemixtae TaxID=1958940 RepID=A0A844ZNP4_9SPHN|nr:12-oxophytodienoate reductase [Pontixanthobacter aquaemixtae]